MIITEDMLIDIPVDILVDIGGTKVLIGYKSSGNNSVSAVNISDVNTYKSKDYNSFDEILDNYLKKLEQQGLKLKLNNLVLAVAGPVVNNNSRLTNLDWVLDSNKLKNKYKAKKVIIINDLEAITADIINNNELINIGIDSDLNKNENIGSGSKAIIAPGTGLGIAYAVYDKNNKSDYIINSSEGGHIAYAPRSELGAELLSYLQRRYNRNNISIETVCSGIGIVNIFDFFIKYKLLEDKDNILVEDCSSVIEASNIDVSKDNLIKNDLNRDPVPIIINKFINNNCEACTKTIELFLEILAGAMQTAGLLYMATGGIYLTGGTAVALSNYITNPKLNNKFLESFYNNNSMSHILKKMPIYLSQDRNTALKGALKFIV